MLGENIIGKIYQEIELKGFVATVKKLGSRIDIQLPFFQEILNSSVEILDLTVRDYNWLKRRGLETINNVIDYINNGELSCVRKLDGKMSSRIKIKLCEYGYSCLSEMEKKKFIENLLSSNKDKFN